jgi:hypothetical protein
MLRVLSATAPHVTVQRFGGTLHVYDENTGQKLAQVDVIRGFSHYTGVAGGAHAGVRAVVAGGIETLVTELASGIRNGRDDRENGV